MFVKYAIAYYNYNFLRSDNSAKKVFPIKSATTIVFSSQKIMPGPILKILLYWPFVVHKSLVVQNLVVQNDLVVQQHFKFGCPK